MTLNIVIPPTDRNGYKTVQVPGSTLVLFLDLQQERIRAIKYDPLLTRYGFTGPAEKFPSTIQALDPLGRCFDNAMETAERYGLVYMEGLLKVRMHGYTQPVAHGWCMSRQGTIIDPTMGELQNSRHLVYCGIPIKASYSHAWKQKMGYFGCLDGAPDGSPSGVYVDSPAKWLDSIIYPPVKVAA